MSRESPWNLLSRFARSLVLSPLRLIDPSTDEITGTTQDGSASKRKVLSAVALSLIALVVRLVETFAFPDGPQRNSTTEEAIRTAIFLGCFVIPTVACGIALSRTKAPSCWRTDAQRRRIRAVGYVGVLLPWALTVILGYVYFHNWIDL